jgi:hypothetical protein
MLDAPVILVNQDARVLDANSDAVSLTGKPIDQILNSLAGDVLGCSFAGLPGGCGQTEYCTNCVIRNSVRKTHESGEPVERCPAVLRCGIADQSHQAKFHISTKKAGSVILVRIEPDT